MTLPLLMTFHASEHDRIALELALVFAKHYGSHLNVWHMLHNPEEDLKSLALTMPTNLLESIKDAEEETQQAAAHKLFHDFVVSSKTHGVETIPGSQEIEHIDHGNPQGQWHICESDSEKQLIRESQLHDLTILAIQESEEHFSLPNVIAKSGRPILMVPQTAKPCPPTHAALLWNGSTEASSAFCLALPMLKTIPRLTIICSAETDDAAMESLRRYLKFHQINPIITRMEEHETINGETIYEHVAQAGADLIVMGAFSKQRFAKRLFGSITKYMLTHSQLPLLMAH